MSTTLLATNPFTDSFTDNIVGLPWIALPSPMTAGCTITEASGVETFTITSGTDAAFTGVFPAPRLELPIFAEDLTGIGTSANNFMATFKITVLTVVGVAGKRAVGGFGLCKVNPDTTHSLLPIIEFGGDNNASKRAYHSWGGAIGSVADVAIPNSGTLPLFVRVLRLDNVVYAEYATTVSGPWFNLTTTAATGSMPRVNGTGGDYARVMLYARNETSGSGITFSVDDFSITCWPRYAQSVVVASLKAKTWQGGSRIDLSWTNPGTGENVPRYMSIRRSRYGHPELHPHLYIGAAPVGLGINTFGEEIYSGVPISSFTDTVLTDRFYYYTIFMTRAPLAANFATDAGTVAQFANQASDTDWGPQAGLQNKVTGLSVRDYYASSGPYMYERFPQTYRAQDEQDRVDIGAARGLLDKWSEFAQAGIDEYRAIIKGAGLIRDADKAPLGMVGDNFDQTSIVDSFLRDRGINPSLPALDALTKRRLWLGAIGCFKLGGSHDGVCNFAKLITGWRTLTCEEPGGDTSSRYLRTWDEVYVKDTFNIAKTSLTYTAGQVVIAGGTLTPSKYKGSYYVDYFGNVKLIIDNTATTITFVDTSWVGYPEVVFTGIKNGANGVDITSGWHFAAHPNDWSYDGAKILPSADNTVRTITLTDYTPTGPSFQVTAAPPAGSTSYAVASAITAGGSFAARVVTHQFHLYSGLPTWLYNPKSDLALIGTVTDPFYVMWLGTNYYGSGTRVTAGIRDYLIRVPTGAAKYASLAVLSTIGATNEIWFTTADLSGATVLPGDYVNPNRNQGQWFRIVHVVVSGGTTKMRVEPVSGMDPAALATVGDIAIIAPRVTVDRDRFVRSILPLILPAGSVLFVYYN